ncbi:MAG: hypothetical protein E2O78_04700 [Caldithrix sp.]|nr:MAG: hypothetical protein E2O78_04700 [Caldithrix sp.]
MAFRRSETPRTLELTSLIDIVFLLLIFFLVSFAFSLSADVSSSRTYSELDLPRTNTSLPVLREDGLENLLVQIMPDSSEGRTRRKVLILWPSFGDTAMVSLGQAFEKAVQDSAFALFPADFLALPEEEFAALPPCTLITDAISRYIATERLYRRGGHPIIEVRAEENTEFKILNFILEVCGSYQDEIPQIIIRTSL